MSGIMLNLVGGTFGPAPLVIGDAYGGGFYAGQISTAGNGIADYNLVVGPKSTAQNNSKQWKTANTTTAGTTSVIDGPANSTAMNNASHPAAQFCKGLTIGGFSDWYSPAKLEVDICYFGLKPTTASNSTGTGINAYSVPTRTSNFTAGNPAQTSASTFKTGNSEAFDTNYYWSSTQYDATRAYFRYFGNGSTGYSTKTYTYRVRAVRRVAV